MDIKKISINKYHIEETYWEKGHKNVCGVDEAGRGPLAGPVCAAAVILNPLDRIEGLDDSKKLSAKKREALYEIIIEKAISYSIVFVDHIVIDKINILRATMEAMKKAIETLSITPEIVLIDGDRKPKLEGEIISQNILGGDAKSATIAAASILAKVSRDKHMLSMDEKFPQYFFKNHKGYGTKKHYEALEIYGPCAVHRKTFLSSYYKKAEALTLGAWGESYIALQLENQGYKILERGFKTKYGEVDIIACNDTTFTAVEVKTYLENSKISPRSAVDKNKQAKIVKAVEEYLKENPNDLEKRFDVAELIIKKDKHIFRVLEENYLKSAFEKEKDVEDY